MAVMDQSTTTVCPDCGEEMPASANYCPSCGKETMTGMQRSLPGLGTFGGVERRTVGLLDAVWRDSGAGPDQMTVTGHASVFGSPSWDLGGFTEYIAPGAFTRALERNPDVFLLWNHDDRYPLARTANNSLKVRQDEQGLDFWARCTRTSYSEDLKRCMEDGLINGASFAMTIAQDDWTVTDDQVTRTINEIGDLYDVTITARGAYPQADATLVRSLALAHARSLGHVSGQTRATQGTVTPDDLGGVEAVTPATVGRTDEAAALRKLQVDIRRRRMAFTKE